MKKIQTIEVNKISEIIETLFLAENPNVFDISDVAQKELEFFTLQNEEKILFAMIDSIHFLTKTEKKALFDFAKFEVINIDTLRVEKTDAYLKADVQSENGELIEICISLQS